jgi:lysophospholipase L1-like esterase
MRISLALVLAVAVAAAALVAVRGDDEPAASETGAVTLVGDSLNVGIEPYLRDALPGWEIDAHDRVGRMTGEGVEQLRELGARLAPVVVVSLGTNDPDGSEPQFRELVDEVIEIVGTGRCLVWATIVRNGTGRTGFDVVLEEASVAHASVRLVDWTGLVAGDRSLLASDLVHGTPDGYARRAEETARAIHRCPGRHAE